MESFARPMLLVYCDDENGEVKVNPEAIAALEQVKGPIALLSVSGADRLGKSSVVNQVLGMNKDFQISSDHQPCSKGLRIWIIPLKTTALDDGIEYNLLLLDAEGIDAYDQVGTYGSQLLSLAVLLSSMLICNQMGGINEAALDCLSCVTKMTKHIDASASEGHDTMSMLGQFSPDSVWPLKNFYQDLVGDGAKMTIHDYLELASKLLPGSVKDIASKNEVLDSLLSEFEGSFHGPSKWQNLSSFMQQSLQGPILLHAKKKIEEVSSENNDLVLKCGSLEDKMELVTKRLESSEKLKNEYRKCYEDAINDIKQLSDPYRSRITELDSRFKSSEERCSYLLKLLDSAAQETLQWKTKCEEMLTEEKATGNQFKAEIAVLKSRISLAEVRVAAANEQSRSAQKEADVWKNKYEVAVEEAKSAQKQGDEWENKYEVAVEEAKAARKEGDEWKNKYEAAVEEAKASLEKVTIEQKSLIMGAQNREDSLRTLLSDSLAEKDTEIKDKVAKLEHAERRVSTLSLELEAADSRIKNYESESSALNLKIKELVDKYEIVQVSSQILKGQVQMLEEKNFLEQKFCSELKRSEDAPERCKVPEKEVWVESELVGTVHKKDFAAETAAVGVQQPTVERLAHVDKTQWHIESLERENQYLASEVDRYRVSEESAISKDALLEVKVKEREEEMKSLLKLINENGVGAVQILKSSSEPECAASSVANEMKSVPPVQPYSMQGEVKLLQQELSSDSKNETQVDSEQRSNYHIKRSRSPKVISDFVFMDTDDGKVEQSKKPKRTITPRRCTIVEDMNSPITTHEDTSGSQKPNSGDYTKFTITELWQELMKHGFGAELLKLKRPKRKEILDLYKKLVIQRQ